MIKAKLKDKLSNGFGFYPKDTECNIVETWINETAKAIYVKLLFEDGNNMITDIKNIEF